MTQVISGTRFVDEVAVDCGVDYTPRHSLAAVLSPELQRALDDAFAFETMPLPEPAPRRATQRTSFDVVIPESKVYPPLMPKSGPSREGFMAKNRESADPDSAPLRCTCPN